LLYTNKTSVEKKNFVFLWEILLTNKENVSNYVNLYRNNQINNYNRKYPDVFVINTSLKSFT
jgi:hypothetical protein